MRRLLWAILGVLLAGPVAAQQPADFYACGESQECMTGGCGNGVCANKSAFEVNSKEFQSLLGMCKDAFTPAEQGLDCVCVAGRCQWQNNPAEEDLIKAAAIAYMLDRYSPACKDNTKVLDVQMIGKDTATARVDCTCGMDCGYACTFSLQKKDGRWQVEEKEYLCAVS